MNPRRTDPIHPCTAAPRRGFTLIELAAAVIIFAGLLVLLIPVAERSRNASGLEVSLNNVRQILTARAAYTSDTAGQIPMRGSRYVNGQITGWETWNFAGKNPDQYWQSWGGGIFDQSAYSRPLNRYLAGLDIPVPTGYLNAGSGTSWNFSPGTATAQQRASLQIPVFLSPGDAATRQRTWPNATAGLSGYDDVGTSYLLNMNWWNMPGLPTNFTARYNEGVNRIRTAATLPPPSSFVWIHDHLGDVLPNLGPTTRLRGQFGDINRSVSGFLDGRAAYLRFTPGAFSGPGYNLWP